MVGLSVILESNHGDFCKKSSQVISKSSVTNNSRSSSSSRTSNSFLQTPSFRLDSCYLCKQKLLPGKDIYMYKGDRGFCSVECRCRQILMDDLEESSIMQDNNYSSSSYVVTSRKTASSSSSESGSSSSSSMAASNSNRKSTRNRRGQLGY